MRNLVPSLALVWTVGCGGPEVTCDNHQDDDGDGFVDCADQDCAASCGPAKPDGVEDCQNGADDDGDWLVDCDDDSCADVCDADADGQLGMAVGGPDCDDTNPDVSPAAAEVPYNGVDDDCNALTPDDDLDADGFVAASDCDDTHAATFPGAPETCGNGVVDDCDATTEPERAVCFTTRTTATADASVVGTIGDQRFGTAISTAGDANGDGQTDFLVGADGDGIFQTGAAFLVLGPGTGTPDAGAAFTTWLGESEDDWAGNAVAFGGDLDGNGADDDLAIAARYNSGTGNAAGSVYIVHNNRGAGTFGLDDRVAKVFAESEYDSAGSAVAGPGDVDGDGFDDLLVGAALHVVGAIPWGAAYVVRGPMTGDVLLAFADYKFLGSGPNENAGCSAAGAGDTNGDGRADIVVGACLYGELDVGIAYHFNSPSLGDQSLFDADGAFKGTGPGDQAGTSVAGAGDTNGDGLDDVLVGAPYNDEGGGPAAMTSFTVDAGAAYLARGPAGVAMNTPTARLLGVAEGDHAGAAVAGVGDLDGDGLADIAVGAPYSDVTAIDGGATYVLFGPIAGTIDLGTADAILGGANPLDLSGASLAFVGDTNQDGFDDLLVGAPSEQGTGAVHLFTFGY